MEAPWCPSREETFFIFISNTTLCNNVWYCPENNSASLSSSSSSGKSGKGGSSVDVDDVTKGLFLSWEDQNYCAPEVKDILDNVIPTSLAGYNSPFVTGGDDFDDGY